MFTARAMRGRSYFWHIFPYILLLAASAAVAVFFVSSRSQRELLFQQAEANLHIRSDLMRTLVLPAVEAGDRSLLQKQVDRLGNDTKTRVTVIEPTGEVLADSLEDPATMEDQTNYPEVTQALTSGRGRSVRYSFTFKKDIVYVTVALIGAAGRKLGVLRLAADPDSLAGVLPPMRHRDLPWLALILFVCAGSAWLLTRRIIRPMIRMKEFAETVAEKRFHSRLQSGQMLPEELHSVVSSLSRIAGDFNNNLSLYMKKENEQGVILRSMTEGVLAVDEDEKVMHINESAFRVLDLAAADYRPGILIQELVRLPGLVNFIHESLRRQEKHERELRLAKGGAEDKIIFVRSNPLDDGHGRILGAVFVLSDITALRRLEKHRQEFVSNVSHELKTPLTLIKGFAETLGGAGQISAEEIKKFAEIIRKHADRLNTLIDDLLTLSKLDKEDAGETLEQGELAVLPVVRTAVECCRQEAVRRGIGLAVSGGEGLAVKGNATLLEQALINLIDNAVKYSPEGERVLVNIERNDGWLKISVIDSGCGIARENQSRLFERFYRVDRGRSRDMGGTGLGLAIVKHIAKIHRGDVSVSSALGKGSTFILKIPLWF